MVILLNTFHHTSWLLRSPISGAVKGRVGVGAANGSDALDYVAINLLNSAFEGNSFQYFGMVLKKLDKKKGWGKSH